jgi:flagellar hook-associated protein FlgK
MIKVVLIDQKDAYLHELNHPIMAQLQIHVDGRRMNFAVADGLSLRFITPNP